MSSFAPSALPPHGASLRASRGSASPIWDRFRNATLIGLLRHSKRFFGRCGTLSVMSLMRRKGLGRDRTGDALQVGSDSRDCKALGREKALDLLLLPGPDLDHEMTGG
jgi:hypothetical protein